MSEATITPTEHAMGNWDITTPTPDVAALAAEVMAVVGKATEGEWRVMACYTNSGTPDEKTSGYIVTDDEFPIGVIDENEAPASNDSLSHNLAAAAAAVNFVRDGLPALMAAQEGEVAGLREALLGHEAHITRMQQSVSSYLQNKIGDKAFISAMIYLLDGPEQRKVQEAARAALAGGK